MSGQKRTRDWIPECTPEEIVANAVKRQKQKDASPLEIQRRALLEEAKNGTLKDLVSIPLDKIVLDEFASLPEKLERNWMRIKGSAQGN